MTAPTNQDERKGKPDLARFLQDWTALWREELQAQANDPERMSPQGSPAESMAMLAGLLPGMSANNPNRTLPAMLAGLLPGISPAAMSAPAPSSDLTAALETWRAAMVAWAETMGVPPSSLVASRDPTASPRSAAVAAASDPRDAEIERLARRVDELEARLAKLESPRRRRG
jgi:hypothetical protein